MNDLKKSPWFDSWWHHPNKSQIANSHGVSDFSFSPYRA